MKKLQLLLVSIAMLSMFSCSDDDDDTLGVWYRRSDFDGRAREDAAGFVIDNRGYLCGGYRGKDQRERDCWEYNIDNDWWTQCADLPEEAAARNGAVGFAINSKGYVTTGYTVYRDDDPLHTGGYAYLKDTWEYEPATDTWKQMDDYPGDARINAIAFAIGNYGYVGTGQSKDDKQTKDFYRFDPTAASGNQWTIVNGFGGQKEPADSPLLSIMSPTLSEEQIMVRMSMTSGSSIPAKVKRTNGYVSGTLQTRAVTITMTITNQSPVPTAVLLS